MTTHYAGVSPLSGMDTRPVMFNIGTSGDYYQKSFILFKSASSCYLSKSQNATKILVKSRLQQQFPYTFSIILLQYYVLPLAIVVQSLLFGIPTDAFPVVALCIIATIVAVFFIAPKYTAWLKSVTRPEHTKE